MLKEQLTDEFLGRLIGKWQANILIRLNEGESWIRTSGELNNSSVFKEKCISQEFFTGSKLEAIGLTTFDIVRNEYGSVWSENSGTGFMIGYGKWNSDFDILGEIGTFTHFSKRKVVQFISTTEFLNSNTYVKKVYFQSLASGFFEVAILTYTRII